MQQCYITYIYKLFLVYHHCMRCTRPQCKMNIGTVSMAMLGKLLRDGVECIYGHFQVHRYHLEQSRTEGRTSNEMAVNRCHLYYKCGLCKEPDV